MQLKESITIDAPSDAVWEYIGSPELWPKFHAKAGKSELLSPTGGIVGAEYEMTLSMGGKTTVSRCEIIDIEFGSMIKLRSTVDAGENKPARTAELTYTLKDKGRRTKVTERTVFSLEGVNIFLRAIVWLIATIGKPKGETSLMKLKRILEEE